MNWTKLPRYFVVASAPLLLEVAIIPGLLTTTRVQAQAPTYTASAPRRNRVTFQPRKDQPAPTVTIGGGVRAGGAARAGNCRQGGQMSGQPDQSQAEVQFLTPLLPTPTENLQLTLSDRPTFLVYVPRTSAKAVEFFLIDNSENLIYQTAIKLTGSPGIISISLPSSAPSLEIGKDYKWIVQMACQSEQAGAVDPYTEGLVRRIQPDSSLSQVNDKATSLEQVALYAQSGVWYEAMADLAALRKAQPNDPEVASAWENLLKDAGLEAIATAPLM